MKDTKIITSVTTESGMDYYFEGVTRDGLLRSFSYLKNKIKIEALLMPIHPKDLSAAKETVRWKKVDCRAVGYNKAGKKTCAVISGHVEAGMVLINPKNGTASTKIKKVYEINSTVAYSSCDFA